MVERNPSSPSRIIAPKTGDKVLAVKTRARTPGEMSPSRKAHYTAKWAHTMTKWLVTYTRKHGARWKLVDFGGETGSESRGIVDLIALRKNHRQEGRGLKRGDLFEIVLIQTKGGSAQRPTRDDLTRMKIVARYHRARAVILAEWRRGKSPALLRLRRSRWVSVSPEDVFG